MHLEQTKKWFVFAVQKALVVAGCLVEAGAAESLKVISTNNRLCEQAAELIFRQVVLDIADRHEPTLAEFAQLIADLVALGREH